MVEYDFLTPFEKEVEREASIDHTLQGEERALFLQAVSDVQQFNDNIRRKFTVKPSPEKWAAFEALRPDLIYLAKENCAYLSIEDKEPLVIEVELRFAVILGGKGEDAIHGGILAQIFDLYRDFSLDTSPDNHVRLQFKVPLFDMVQSP